MLLSLLVLAGDNQTKADIILMTIICSVSSASGQWLLCRHTSLPFQRHVTSNRMMTEEREARPSCSYSANRGPNSSNNGTEARKQ